MPMTSYIALLRGINVSGKNAIRMEALRGSVAGLGLQDVQTCLQSGNLVFRTAKSDEAALAAAIQARITRDFGFEVPVLVLSAQQLGLIASANPLWPKTGGEAAQFHCTFLFQPVTPSLFRALKLPVTMDEQAILVDRAVLLHCPHGYGKTKLNNSYFERALGLCATTRNWRTVLTLQTLCHPPQAPL